MWGEINTTMSFASFAYFYKSMRKLNKVIRLFILLTISIVFFSCDQNPSSNIATSSSDRSKTKIAQTEIKALPIPDSLFALKNIKNSYIKIAGGDGESLFLMNNSNIKFTRIDTPKFKKIIEFLDTSWSGDSYYFISKQEKAGDYQPIIVDVDASHFNDLVFMVLNKYNIPVSYLVLNDGEYEDNETVFDEKDSIHRSFHCGASSIENNKVYWYKVNNYSIEWRIQLNPGEKAHLMGGPRWPYDDSIKYLSVIQSNGMITTKLLDSVRWMRGARPYKK